jgi:hypothetical protein
LPDKGYITLGRIAERLNVLVVSCDRCGRRRQYPLWKLIVKYGAEASIEPLQQQITADCPNRTDPKIELGKGCAPACPDLPKLRS